MRTSLTCAAAACIVGLSLTALAAPAYADPGGETFTLSCDDGQTYDIVTARGRGNWTPGFDIASTTVFVPMAFGAFTGTAYLASEYPGGDPLFSFEDPNTSTKPAVARGLARLDCTFEQISVEYDPELDTEIVFVGTGDVTVGVRR